MCPSEVRHATWKIPLKHLQNNSTASPSSPFLHYLWSLQPKASPLPDSSVCTCLFTAPPSCWLCLFSLKLDSEAALFREIYFSICHAPSVFFSFPLQAIAQWEEDSKERELEKERQTILSRIVSSSAWSGAAAAALLAILKTSFVNKNAPSMRSSMSPYLRKSARKKDTSDKSTGAVCFSETSWVGGCSWLEMIEWHPWARLCISWSGPHLATSHLSKWPLVCQQLVITTLHLRWRGEWIEGKEEGDAWDCLE